MLALMLDPCIKSLQIVENFVGHENANCHVAKYNLKEVITLLMIVFDKLNPIIHPNNVYSAN
jgi:hypothetical protein